MILSPVGFGSYRVSNRSAEHKSALLKAIDEGCNLIDTSTNYTGGESELLIGEVINERPDNRIFVVSKAGYVQGQRIEEVQALVDEGKCKEGLIKVSEGLCHSIHPDFLELELENSLKRLGIEKIDVYLLHNPEYFFEEDGATQDEYYRRIEKAFSFLESKVLEGKIKYYGISSNNFPFDTDDPRVTNLDKVYEAAVNVSKDHHFKYIQFPFNMIEIDALEKHYGSLNLIERAKKYGIKTIANRPLNAFRSKQLVRLATYADNFDLVTLEEATLKFEACFKSLEQKWKDQESEDLLEDITLIKQVKEMWKSLPTPDSVDQIFHGHFFPLVAGIWGEEGLSAEESVPFYEFYEACLDLSRRNMDSIAKDFREQSERMGLLPMASNKSLSVLVIEKYLELGIDHVLVGMKRDFYVDQFKHLFK